MIVVDATHFVCYTDKDEVYIYPNIVLKTMSIKLNLNEDQALEYAKS